MLDTTRIRSDGLLGSIVFFTRVDTLSEVDVISETMAPEVWVCKVSCFVVVSTVVYSSVVPAVGTCRDVLFETEFGKAVKLYRMPALLFSIVIFLGVSLLPRVDLISMMTKTIKIKTPEAKFLIRYFL